MDMISKKCSDKNLEYLLKQMPPIQDKRPSQIIYRNIQLVLAKKQKRKRVIPILAAAAAFSILLILTPALFQEVSLPGDTNKKENYPILQEYSQKHKDRPTRSETNIITKIKKDQDILIFGVPDQQGQNVIPLSLIIKKQDSPYVELLDEYKGEFEPRKLGLGHYFLTDFNLKEGKGKDILIDVPEKNDLNLGSVYNNIFNQSVFESFRGSGYLNAQYFTGGKRGILFGEMAEPENGISLSRYENKGYLIFQKDKDAPEFLAPSPFNFKSFYAALMDMRKSKEEWHLQSSIPENVAIEKSVGNEKLKQVVVFFKKGTELEDIPKNRLMIEAIMMAAKEFGYQSISFEGIKKPQRIGNIQLHKKNKVPLAPNPINEDIVN